MALQPHLIPPVPSATAAAVHAAFPKGNLYVDLRAEFGTLYTDDLFADLYPSSGRPVTVRPWRLALVLVMQYMEGLTDRQAADAVRRCMDWKYVLSLELTDPGFDFTLLHDFRQRLLAHTAGQRLLDAFLTSCKTSGLIKVRGTQRTDSTHVLATIRTLNRLECVVEAMRFALNRLARVAPNWIRTTLPGDWYERYGLRAENARLPKELSQRQALAEQVGQDGYTLLSSLFARDTPPLLSTLPAVDVLRRVWIQQFYCSTIPGAETLRWRTVDESAPSAQLIHSPYDHEARYSSKGETSWVGYKVHISETCDPHRPHLITQVITTAATTQDSVMGPTIQHDLAQRDVLPATHLLDGGYVDAQRAPGPTADCSRRACRLTHDFPNRVKASFTDVITYRGRYPDDGTASRATGGRNSSQFSATTNESPVLRMSWLHVSRAAAGGRGGQRRGCDAGRDGAARRASKYQLFCVHRHAQGQDAAALRSPARPQPACLGDKQA